MRYAFRPFDCFEGSFFTLSRNAVLRSVGRPCFFNKSLKASLANSWKSIMRSRASKFTACHVSSSNRTRLPGICTPQLIDLTAVLLIEDAGGFVPGTVQEFYTPRSAVRLMIVETSEGVRASHVSSRAKMIERLRVAASLCRSAHEKRLSTAWPSSGTRAPSANPSRVSIKSELERLEAWRRKG